MVPFTQAVFVLLGLAALQAPVTQGVDTITLRVGSSHVDGRLLKPYRQRFVGYSNPCTYSGDSSYQFVVETDQLELLASKADSSWLLITTSVYRDGRHVIDSTFYDYRTLAAKRGRYGLQGSMHTSLAIQGEHVSWFDSADSPPIRLDSTFAEAGFLDGSAELIIEATPLLSSGRGVVAKVPMVGMGVNIPDYYLYQEWRVVRESPQQQQPSRVPPGSVAIQVDGSTFWVQPKSRHIVAKRSPEYEGTCAITYVLESP